MIRPTLLDTTCAVKPWGFTGDRFKINALSIDSHYKGKTTSRQSYQDCLYIETGPWIPYSWQGFTWGLRNIVLGHLNAWCHCRCFYGTKWSPAANTKGDPLQSRAACTQPCNVNTHSRAHWSPGARLCEQWGHGCVNNGARLCASARLCRGSQRAAGSLELIARQLGSGRGVRNFSIYRAK